MPQKNEIAAYCSEQLGITGEGTRFAHDTALSDSSAAAFGTALRGLITREEDTLISLLPIGTEEAYRKRRFLAYVSLWSDIINATALLFVALFGASLLFLNITEKNAAAQNARLTTTNTQSNKAEKLKQEAVRFNSVVSAVAQANDTIVSFSPVIQEVLPALRHDGITITTIAITPSGTDLRVSATAATRDNAIAFRKSLENNPLFTGVAVPPLNVTQRISIPLDITLSLKPRQP